MNIEKVIKTGTQAQRLNLEIGAKLMTTFKGQDMAVKALLIGMEPGVFLVLKLPEIIGLKDLLFEGNQTSVRYISWGMVFGFKTQILDYVKEDDLNLVVLSYPKTVKTYDLRKEPRTESFLPAALNVEEDNFAGFLMGLSPGGCRFSFDKSSGKSGFDIKIGQKVKISFKLPGLESTQKFVCKTQNIQRDNDSLSLGLQFDLES
ncbi:MAG: flagellar brake protein, partial [Deltaproteobacteria bacterium]|nr:flagellar brake protein [Deltaproteobacteria bacterium]